MLPRINLRKFVQFVVKNISEINEMINLQRALGSLVNFISTINDLKSTTVKKITEQA